MWRIAALFVAAVTIQSSEVVEPRVSLVYCGVPQGSPRAADLEAARTLGFSAISWTCGTRGSAELIRLAAPLGLKLVISDPPAVESVLIDTNRVRPEAMWPLACRAVAHGARIVTVAAGMGVPIDRLAAQPPLWAASVAGVERQFRANGALFAQSHPGPAVRVDEGPSSVDVALLDAGRSWIAIATNTAAARARLTARLPPAVPYAMWVNLLDGSTMAMLDEPAGPRWAFDLDAWSAKVYVIDKTLK